jgi:regulatory protein
LLDDYLQQAAGIGTTPFANVGIGAELGRIPDEAVRFVQTFLAADGLQSDARCAESMIHARVSRGQGPLMIRAGLREAGLEGETVELLLEAEAEAWPEHLEAVARTRFGEAPPADRRDWARRARFLAGRGFPEHLVRNQLGEPPRS